MHTEVVRTPALKRRCHPPSWANESVKRSGLCEHGLLCPMLPSVPQPELFSDGKEGACRLEIIPGCGVSLDVSPMRSGKAGGECQT